MLNWKFIKRDGNPEKTETSYLVLGKNNILRSCVWKDDHFEFDMPGHIWFSDPVAYLDFNDINPKFSWKSVKFDGNPSENSKTTYCIVTVEKEDGTRELEVARWNKDKNDWLICRTSEKRKVIAYLDINDIKLYDGE